MQRKMECWVRLVTRAVIVGCLLSVALAMRTPLKVQRNATSTTTTTPDEVTAPSLPTSTVEADATTQVGMEAETEPGSSLGMLESKIGTNAMQESGAKEEEKLKTKPERLQPGMKVEAEVGMELKLEPGINVNMVAKPEVGTKTVMEMGSQAGMEAIKEAGLEVSPEIEQEEVAEEEDEAQLRLGAFADDGLTHSDLKERYLVSALGLRRQRCAGAVGGRSVGGVCLDKAECALKRGHKAGSCPLLGSCCYFQHTCGEKSHYKVSHFASPTTTTDPTECDFRVHIINRDICQIRVDFEEFSLAQPERSGTPADDERLGGWRCLRDRFTVEAPGTSNGALGFDALCGENTGQHLYIPVNASDGKASVRLLFYLASRTRVDATTTALAPARWLLRVTQLECAAAPPAAGATPVHTAIAIAAQHHTNKHVLHATDLELIAPPGCLQYHPNRQGQYESFNYPALRYLANLHYAICFRRRPDDCGIRHTVLDSFLLDFNRQEDPPINFADRACDTRNPDQPYTHAGDDYLFVPNGIILENRLANPVTFLLASKICGEALTTGQTIVSYAPGPFFVYFHSDDFTFIDHISDEGFRFRYDMETGRCTTADPMTG